MKKTDNIIFTITPDQADTILEEAEYRGFTDKGKKREDYDDYEICELLDRFIDIL